MNLSMETYSDLADAKHYVEDKYRRWLAAKSDTDLLLMEYQWRDGYNQDLDCERAKSFLKAELDRRVERVME